jgi:two-component system, LytTR family, sensor kinase
MNGLWSWSARHRAWIGWLVIVTIWWTLDGFTDVMNYRVMSPAPAVAMSRIWRAYMLSAWLWIPLTMLAFWTANRFPIAGSAWRHWVPAHLASAAGACVARAVAVLLLNEWGGWYASLPSLGELLVTSLANNFFLYCMLIGVGHAIVYGRRIRERDEQLARAELHALKMQLHPHFLFNTLNTINTYVRADPNVAQRMISRLSDLLRRALESERVQEVALHEELAFVGAYLDIEQVRLDDRLRVEWLIEPDTLQATVPHLILQPLVENAIRHGIAPRLAEGTVDIVARRANGALRLEIRDDGAGMRESSADGGGGHGLSNTRNRLQQLYGDRQTMTIRAPSSGGFAVEISIPYRERSRDGGTR